MHWWFEQALTGQDEGPSPTPTTPPWPDYATVVRALESAYIDVTAATAPPTEDLTAELDRLIACTSKDDGPHGLASRPPDHRLAATLEDFAGRN